MQQWLSTLIVKVLHSFKSVPFFYTQIFVLNDRILTILIYNSCHNRNTDFWACETIGEETIRGIIGSLILPIHIIETRIKSF